MLRSHSLIAATLLVIYGFFIDHHRCQSLEEVRDLIAHLHHHRRGNGVRTTAHGFKKRPSLDPAVSTRMTRQTSEDADDNDDTPVQYLHYAARSDDDNQYRDHDYDRHADDGFAVDDDDDDDQRRRVGVTGPVHTYIKTDKNANFKWGVRHFAGKQYRGGPRWLS